MRVRACACVYVCGRESEIWKETILVQIYSFINPHEFMRHF
jgi:hypothetical protein